ncbi:hypothetical protein DES53_11324 [Roseimicrobium gellanilyticum]|uniref:Uncharacterized protein n=1 Tax=Roseimicrobium gellanilyticum TaxID=748857 RepID=A0A366H812_9BACT|nr:hypothetical protein [Roseimicrobium gellanilyticum]RBP37642.1 hypothetical protein DES53_11324 [Roseimicrobium gellanilyticum]
MPNLKAFEDIIATSKGTANQFVATKDGGLAFKGNAGRLATYVSSSYQDVDKDMLRSFKTALTDAYGPEVAELAWKKAGLDVRLRDGLPLSVKEANAAIEAAKASVKILAEHAEYGKQYRSLEEEARSWDPKPQASKVEGAGFRLIKQDQGEFRIHHWNAKNNPESVSDKSKAAELDELVHKEVAAIKAQRQKDLSEGRKVEPMSERLIYLQAKLNLTERMVSEACQPENLKEGGPKANIFLGPDMFFSPSSGPAVKGFACKKTTGGACTEEEMKRITEGLRRISDRHPEVTLMPGTIVWSKPSPTVPVIDGLPRPADMAFNNAPVFNKGELVHITYKMTDGGDASWAATGINGPGGSFSTAPSAGNQYKARLQVFLGNDLMNGAIGVEGMEKVQPILDAMGTQAGQRSPGREWENGLRSGGADARSPYNTVFVVEGKVMALEICRDHTNGQAKKDFTRLKNSDDAVSRLAKSQPDGGANLHVLLSASNMMTPSNTICCTGGIAAQNDVSGGCSTSFLIQKRISQDMAQPKPGSKQQVFHYQHDEAQRKAMAPEAPRVGLSDVGVKRDDPVKLEPSLLTPPDPGIPRSSVRDVMRESASSGAKVKVGVVESTTEQTTLTTGTKTVRSESGLDKPKVGVSSNTNTVSVGTSL